MIKWLLNQAAIGSYMLTLGRTRKFIPPPWYGGGGGWAVDGNPPRSFWYVSVFWNDFTFDLLNKMRYILEVVALPKFCDLIYNGRILDFTKN